MEDKLESINKDLIKTKIIGAPGMIMVGLGMYGMFGAKGHAFHPLLNNTDFSYTLLIVGGVIAIWEAIKVISLSKEKAKLENI